MTSGEWGVIKAETFDDNEEQEISNHQPLVIGTDFFGLLCCLFVYVSYLLCSRNGLEHETVLFIYRWV